MATAKKLPSGNWRVRVLTGYKIVDGEKVRDYVSITEPTEEKANFKAAEYELKYKDIKRDSSNMTFSEAIDDYINSKSNILSPATIRGYRAIQHNRLQLIMTAKLNQLTKAKIQTAINEDSGECSAKTVANAYFLLKAILSEYRPEFIFKVSLPQKKPYQANALNAEQIGTLISAVQGTDIEIPVLLALWLGLRRSEILALKWSAVDFENQALIIDSAMVPDEHHKMVLKGTKTVTSTRVLKMPQYISEKLKALPRGEDDFVVHINPITLRKHLVKFLKANNLPEIRLHDLRHTMASVGLSLNIADKYMMERGGWASAQTMKKIYQHTFSEEKLTAENLINSYFESAIKSVSDTKCDTTKK